MKDLDKDNKIFLAEIYLKNLILVISVFFLYSAVKEAFSEVTDPDVLSNLILFVGLMIVVPLFACYTFTYEYVNCKSVVQRYLGHAIAFSIMFVAFVLLQMIDILFVASIGNIVLFRLVILLYGISLLLYDFWDALRVLNRDN